MTAAAQGVLAGRPAPHSHQPWVSSVTANLAARVFALLSAVVVARALGPEGRGVLAAVMLWPTMVEHASVINVPTVTYFGAKYGNRGMQACIRLGIVMVVLLVPISLAVNWLVMRDRGESLRFANWFTLIIPLMIAAALVGGALLAEEKIAAFWSLRVTTTLLTALVAPVLALAGVLSVGSYVITFLVATGIGVLVAVRMRGNLKDHAPGSEPLTPAVLRFGGRTLLTSLAAQLNLKLDQLAISLLLPAAVLGQYVVATSWASAVYIASSAMSVVVVSRTSRANAVDEADRAAAVDRVRRSGTFSMLVAICVAVLAPFAIPLIFGERFQSAVVPAFLLALAAGAIGWKGALHDLARGFGNPSAGRLPELVGLATRAAVLGLLLNVSGASGAATAAILGSFVVVAVFTYRISATTGMPVPSFTPGPSDVRFLFSTATNYVLHQRERFRRSA